MTQNFRKTVMATTMLAGFAIFALDAAQAGPNGGPSLGSISGFSSMRMDFNRIGGPGRALSRDDMRVVPLEVKKTIPSGIMPLLDKKDDNKNIAKKKGTNVARVSNPKPANGGKGKQDVGSGPNLHIPAAVAELYSVTGGNIGDVSGFGEWAERVKIGPLVVANPLFPAQGGGTFAPPSLGGGGPKGGEQADRNFLDGWSGYGGAPGGPDTSKTGQASQDSRPSRLWIHGMRTGGDGGQTGANSHVQREWGYDRRDPSSTYYLVRERNSDGSSTTTFTRKSADGQTERFWMIHDSEGNTVDSWHADTSSGKGAAENEKPEKEKPEKEKDSQPVAEGSGRPSNGGGGWCSPTGGCLRPARNNGSPRIIPTEESSTPAAQRQSPTWATDPSEEGYSGGGGGGGGYTGYRPQDEQGGGIGGPGGPGNPALEGLNAAL
jgi:hypothetical protein